MLILRIKKSWLDKILSGEKIIEYREFSEYYQKRFKKQYDKVRFLCGKIVCNYEILKIEVVNNGDLGNKKQFAIYLGDKLDE